MTKGWPYSVDPNYAGMYTFKTTFTDVPKTTVSKVKNLSSGKLKVTWKCKSKATGYQIQIATDKKFKKNKKVYDAPFKNYNNCTFWDLKKQDLLCSCPFLCKGRLPREEMLFCMEQI